MGTDRRPPVSWSLPYGVCRSPRAFERGLAPSTSAVPGRPQRAYKRRPGCRAPRMYLLVESDARVLSGVVTACRTHVTASRDSRAKSLGNPVKHHASYPWSTSNNLLTFHLLLTLVSDGHRNDFYKQVRQGCLEGRIFGERCAVLALVVLASVISRLSILGSLPSCCWFVRALPLSRI